MHKRRFGKSFVARGLTPLGAMIVWLVSLAASGCSEPQSSGSGGSPNGGSPEGGRADGGQGGKVATGGAMPSGGTSATGGLATGGANTGGTSSAGNATGSTNTGGTSSAGNATGGTALGGGNSGGAATTGGSNAGTNAGAGAGQGGNASGGATTTGGSNAGTNAGAGAGQGGNASGGTAGGSNGALGSSDEFEGTSLGSSWTVFRGDLVDIEVAGGTLALTPHAKALWYQASQGPLVYKTVTGDFKVTATVHARKASNRSMTPMQFADVGGLMARNPSNSSENYVLGVVGYAEMNQLAIEHKSTTNSNSQYGETAFSADAELRLCRTGSTFTIYYRHPGDTGWPSSVAPINRTDLPQTLQVGLIAYTGAPSPDYVSIFDQVAFEAVGAGCNQ